MIRSQCSRCFKNFIAASVQFPGSCCYPFGANPQAVHFVKEYTPSAEHTWKENHKYDHIYTTNESSLVLHILKMRGRVHNCPFESIWFAISQPLCIMYMTNIYSCFTQISHVPCMWPSDCPCLFILNTRHRGYIFCPGSFGYCKPRSIPTYVFISNIQTVSPYSGCLLNAYKTVQLSWAVACSLPLNAIVINI